jgi:hypothetical protein
MLLVDYNARCKKKHEKTKIKILCYEFRHAGIYETESLRAERQMA